MRRMHARRGSADQPWMDEALPPVGAPASEREPRLRDDADTPWGDDPLAFPPPLDAADDDRGPPRRWDDDDGPSVPGADASEPARSGAGCAACAHRTAFGNCADPVAAGLAGRFMLVAHPRDGIGCPARLPRDAHPVAYFRLHGAVGTRDVAVCPPMSADALRARFPRAQRVDPLEPDEAWPDPASEDDTRDEPRPGRSVG